MATISDLLGSGGSAGGAGPEAGFLTPYRVISPAEDPTFSRIAGEVEAAIPRQMQSLQSIIQGGMNSPLLQEILGPMLARLQAPQAQQRSQLTEATRAAGGLRGSTYGQDFTRLQNQQGQQQNDLMAAVLQQVLGQVISGSLQENQQSFLPAQNLMNLLGALRPQVQTGLPPQQAGGGGSGSFGGGGIGNFFDEPGAFDYRFSPDYNSNYGGFGGRAPASGGNTPTFTGGAVGRDTPLVGGNMTPPEYVDPFATGGFGGGQYDIGAGTQYAYSPAVQPPRDPFEHSYGAWEPDYSEYY